MVEGKQRKVKVTHLAQVSSSNRKTSDFNSIDSTILAAILVDPDALFVLKDLGSIFAASGRLSMKGEMSTPKNKVATSIHERHYLLSVICLKYKSIL
jgi:hypothetical protein